MAPLRADSRKSSQPPEADEPTTFECPPGIAGLKVLVVDDEPETQELLSFVIEQCGARVVTAGSAAEARERLISDVGMPGEDGHSLVRSVRALPDGRGTLLALALTAYARGEDRTRALTTESRFQARTA
jgi:CheY-like chemotaxis protein